MNSGFSLPFGDIVNARSEPSGPPIGHGSSTESGHGGHGGYGVASDYSYSSHDISGMPDNPPKYTGHRRARSEIVTLPDDLSLDGDHGVVGGFDGPSHSDETEEDCFSMYLDMDRFNSSSATSGSQMGDSSSSAVQTLSAATPPATAATLRPENHGGSSGERCRAKHQHCVSMDGSASIKPEMLTSGPEETSSTDAKRSNLAELDLVDPKRAKRIWANRQSAARSKERKMRYIVELERKVHVLQTEAASLPTQLTFLQRDTDGLAAENSELKLRVQTMEQQVHLQDGLNEALKEEMQHLKVVTGQNRMNGGPVMNFPPQFQPKVPAQQFRQLQIQSQNHQAFQHQFQHHRQLSPQTANLKNRSFLAALSLKEYNSSKFNSHTPPRIE